MTSPSLFQALHHICVVVPDLDAAVAYYTSIGVGPWTDFPSLEPYRHELQVPNADDFMRLKYRFANLGGVQLQLCEPPPGDTEQRRFLEQRGGGVFHLGFTVDDLDAAEAAANQHGMPTLMRGRLPDRSGFTYFDNRDQAGVVLELRQPRKA
jgi:catechol 2,3-dioxygenase-like lactoylglutathione lyase family enzyme